MVEVAKTGACGSSVADLASKHALGRNGAASSL